FEELFPVNGKVSFAGNVSSSPIPKIGKNEVDVELRIFCSLLRNDFKSNRAYTIIYHQCTPFTYIECLKCTPFFSKVLYCACLLSHSTPIYTTKSLSLSFPVDEFTPSPLLSKNGLLSGQVLPIRGKSRHRDCRYSGHRLRNRRATGSRGRGCRHLQQEGQECAGRPYLSPQSRLQEGRGHRLPCRKGGGQAATRPLYAFQIRPDRRACEQSRHQSHLRGSSRCRGQNVGPSLRDERQERLADDQARRATHEESRRRIDHLQCLVRWIQSTIARNRRLCDHKDCNAGSGEGTGRITGQL
ncbi:hypothetical protein PENTCL1PPCAC_3530, partial [Pristionchus entomophagus]